MVLRDAPDIKRNPELLRHEAQVLVVRYDTGDVAGKLASLPSGQQVVQAVAHLTHENRHPRAFVAIKQAEFHVEALREERVDIQVDLLPRNQKTLQLPLDPHEKHIVHLIYILIQVDNVPFILSNECCHFRNDALPVRAMQKQNGRCIRTAHTLSN